MRGKKILNFSIIAISFTILILTFVAVPPPVFAGHCTTTVTAPANIQTAVDGATSGDVVCLSGTFRQSVVFGPEDSGITLSEADSATAILDGSGTADSGTFLTVNWAILLKDGLSDVTIENLEIRNYAGLGGGGQGNAIQAWDVSTSNIIVRNNDMHGNGWNGVLVGSEGGNGKIHSNWMVRNNVVKDNGFVGIELTNCNSCTIMKNNVDGNFLLDIVVQARNTIAGTGQVAINGVRVLHNTVGSSFIGIYVLSFTGNPTNFSPITDASTLLTNVNISHNTVTDSTVSEIRFWAFNTAATAENGKIIKNVLNCDIADSATGIEILERGLSGQTGTVKNVKVVNNKVDGDCNTITNEGEATKLPPGGPFP